MTINASPALQLVFASILMYLLLDIHLFKMPRKRIIAAGIFFCAILLFNGFAENYFGNVIYLKYYALFGQLPVFVFFYFFSRYRGIKLVFVLLTTVFLMGPSATVVIILMHFFTLSFATKLAINIVTYIIVIFLVWKFLKPQFNYMLEHAENKLFWIFSVVPVLAYVYTYGKTQYRFYDKFVQEGNLLDYIPYVLCYASYILLMYIFNVTREKNRIESEKNVLSLHMETAKQQLLDMRFMQEQAALYRHDMRHHFVLISGFLDANEPQKAASYIKTAQEGIESITPHRYCQNETVNLILSSFAAKAQSIGIDFSIQATLPAQLVFDDTELCALLSNALENAITAVSAIEDESLKRIRVQCMIRREKLLLLTENAYTGEIIFENGVPQSKAEGHGFGTKSMVAIAAKHNGDCYFEAIDGIFTVRLVLPLKAAATAF